jgi:hypothetical protein
VKKVIFLLLLALFSASLLSQPNTKYQKWNIPGFFRGFNVLYENPKSLQDFKDFKNYGGNLMEIGTDGFMDEDPPYTVQNSNIDGTDLLVNYCRQVSITLSLSAQDRELMILTTNLRAIPVNQGFGIPAIRLNSKNTPIC